MTERTLRDLSEARYTLHVQGGGKNGQRRLVCSFCGRHRSASFLRPFAVNDPRLICDPCLTEDADSSKIRQRGR